MTLKVLFAVWTLFLLVVIVLPAAAQTPFADHSGAVPARMELRAERSHVTADDEDNIVLTAFVYDAQGNPVADGYKVNFTIGSAERNNFTGNGNYNYVPGSDGRLGSPDNPDNFYQGVTTNDSGTASVQFGWIDELYAGNNSTVWAYSADNASVFASIKIYSAAPTAAWTGYVVDESGEGLGGITVKLHVMGTINNQPFEIYNMTRATSSTPPFVGRFAFDYIVVTGNVYGYVEAEARLPDNLTVHGKSDNLSMNGSTVEIGTIILNIPSPDAANATAVASPSATTGPPRASSTCWRWRGCWAWPAGSRTNTFSRVSTLAKAGPAAGDTLIT